VTLRDTGGGFAYAGDACEFDGSRHANIGRTHDNNADHTVDPSADGPVARPSDTDSSTLIQEEDMASRIVNSASRARRALRQWPLVAAAAASLVLTSVSFADMPASPVGMWQTIDDHTGQPKALVQISQDADGTLSGKIVKGLASNDQPDRRCEKCSDYRKDQLMLGMTIINGMKPDGDKYDGGQILDPENGSLYKCTMHTEDGGQKLVVRGYIGISLIGRSQTWNRQP
jgi:uncharacterized protein (DUF2147 family)